MIKSNDADEIRYDVESQIVVLKNIVHFIRNDLPVEAELDFQNAQQELEHIKYFVRENCRTDEIPDELSELKSEHGRLCDAIESFAGVWPFEYEPNQI